MPGIEIKGRSKIANYRHGGRTGLKHGKSAITSRSIVKDVYDAVAPKHSPGQKKKPHSSKEGRTASLGRTVRDVGKILSPKRDKKFGGGRTNLLEQLGRVEAEPSNPNRRAEISRVHGELNRGYAKGGAVRKLGRGIGRALKGREGRRKDFKTHGKDVPTMAAKGGRIGLKKGGKPWGTGPKPGSHEFLMQHLNKPRKGKAIGGTARAIKGAADRVLKPKGVFKKDIYKRPGEKPPQLRKSQKERREELRKKARKSGGHSKIVFADEWKKIDPGLQKGLFKKEGGRIGLKKGKAVTKVDLARRDLWTKRELKKRADKKREKKWDIKDVITSHPLNPFKVHAEAKAYDFSSKRKDVYGRTRDDLKKSRDPEVKKVAEGFQQMDYKDADKGTQFENRNEPKLKKQIHRMRGDTRPSGRIDREGFKKGGSDKKWIQKAVDPKHKGYCTPMTKKTCTPARKALARTFKKKAKTGWG